MLRKIVFLVGLVILAVFAVLMTLSMKRYLDRPSPKDWGPVDRFVSSQQKPGDAAAFFPPWLAGYATDHRRFEGLSIVSEADLRSKALGATIERLWIIQCFDSFDAGKLKSDYVEVSSRTIGKVRVQLFRRKGIEVSYRLSDRLREAAVGLKIGGALSPFQRSASGFELPGREIKPQRARFRRLEKSGLPVPLTKKDEIVFDLDSLPEGDVLLCGGISDAGLDKLDFHPVEAVLALPGGQMPKVIWRGRSGWYCSNIGRPSAAGSAQIRFRSSATQPRLFLFDLIVSNPSASSTS